MAKTDPTKADAADLNAEGAALDLNAAGVPQDLNAEGAEPGPSTTGDALNPDEGEEDTEGPEYVVLKGNHIRHDGEIYRENMTIPVTGADAARLLKAGVIGDIEQLRQRVLSAQPSVSVTSE
ncbi:hypothetical protein UYSO10_4948 [Kosakonia radicincitans]|uniref:hypothetical protein n=1 Tax=Kosakonia radicincitans TaxID=283686 RepID=UPI00118251EE|nr:hypothetical protein [Kosakonia radicincitans]VVT53910.1 hypothetical protein UYSO10_4948 [Kosakonia radicincitans]